MIIKLLDENDVEDYKNEIFELIKNCFDLTYSVSVSDSYVFEKINGLKNYINEGKAYVFGAINDDGLIGFLWGYPLETMFEKSFHVAYISVLEVGRKKGVGKQLIKAAEKITNDLKIESMELIVGANNYTALEFYKNCGFDVERYYFRKELN